MNVAARLEVWPIPEAFASPPAFKRTWPGVSTSPSKTWASRASRTLPARCGYTGADRDRGEHDETDTDRRRTSTRRSPTNLYRGIAIQNMSGDPEQEYFADGMVEEIITALSRIAGCSSSPAIRVSRIKGKPSM